MLRWQVEALEQLVRAMDVDIPLVVVNTTDDLSHPGYSRGASSLEAEAVRNGFGTADLELFYHVAKRESWWVAVLVERKLAWLLGLDETGPMARQPLDGIDVLAGADRIECTPVPIDGPWCDLPEEVIGRVAEDADVAIAFGFNLLRGEILSAADYGVVGFHPGDIREYRGLSPARMFLNGDERAGATLQQYTDRLDGGNVLAIDSVDVSDVRTLDELQRRLVCLQRDMLPTGLERLFDPEFEPEPPDTLGEYVSLDTRRTPRFAGSVLYKNLLGRLRTLLGRQ
jgi:hypothetical protein